MTVFEKQSILGGNVRTLGKKCRGCQNGVQIELAGDAKHDFDKVIFACPPDQVLKLLADPTAEEQTRFGAWRPNHATTLIHHDEGLYQRYGVRAFTEFDVFRKPNGNAGYNAYLNR